jgi:hypothetical protein
LCPNPVSQEQHYYNGIYLLNIFQGSKKDQNKIICIFFQSDAEILLCNFDVFLWFLALADGWWNTLGLVQTADFVGVNLTSLNLQCHDAQLIAKH